MVVIEIIEQADILNAIERGYNIELVKKGYMTLSRPSEAQLNAEEQGAYYEKGEIC